MGKFAVTWQETYEMSAEIEAEDLAGALRKAGNLMDGTPSFEFLDAWQPAGESDECEGMISTRFMDTTVSAEVKGVVGPFCLPVGDDEPESEIPVVAWPSEEEK